MSRHRNPRPNVPKPSSTHNPPRRPRGTHAAPIPPRAMQEMRVAFRDLVRLNPHAASATLDVLEIVAHSNRARALRLIEAASTVIASIRGGAR